MRPEFSVLLLWQELSLLQDRVPAFEPARAIAIVESELGGPLSSHFRSFERSPIAAASLGQARLSLQPLQ